MDEVREFLNKELLDRCAVKFLCDLLSISIYFDDLIDKDVDPEEIQNQLRHLYNLTLYEYPTNPFYVANANTLAPCIKMVMNNWETANRIEAEALKHRQETGKEIEHGSELHRLLQVSFELRFSVMNLAPTVFEICHGPIGKDDFSWEWCKLTRSPDDGFESYAKKVTRKRRPIKRYGLG